MTDTSSDERPSTSGVRDALDAYQAGVRLLDAFAEHEREDAVDDLAAIVEAVTGGRRRKDQRDDLLDALRQHATPKDRQPSEGEGLPELGVRMDDAVQPRPVADAPQA